MSAYVCVAIVCTCVCVCVFAHHTCFVTRLYLHTHTHTHACNHYYFVIFIIFLTFLTFNIVPVATCFIFFINLYIVVAWGPTPPSHTCHPGIHCHGDKPGNHSRFLAHAAKPHLFGLDIFSIDILYFKNTVNLFIHIARIPIGDSPRVHPNILKCPLHSPVAKGYRLVVIASRAMVCKTPTYYLILESLAYARGCVILRSHILFLLLLILLIFHHIHS